MYNEELKRIEDLKAEEIQEKAQLILDLIGYDMVNKVKAKTAEIEG